MRVEMADVEGTLLREIADSTLTRDDVAQTYAFGLRQPADAVDWGLVNQAIMERWSLSALKYIKKKAWRSVRA